MKKSLNLKFNIFLQFCVLTSSFRMELEREGEREREKVEGRGREGDKEITIKDRNEGDIMS